jgi:uncharacterized protein (TIGR02246 family)
MRKPARGLFVSFLLICLPVLSLRATQPRTAAGTKEEAAVRKVLSGLGAADGTGDLAAVLSLYAEDAALLPPNSPVLSGQAGVRSFYEPAFQRFHFEVSFDVDEIHVVGDWAFAQGFINGQFISKQESAPPRKLHEKFLMVLHHEKDAWKIYRIIWNASEPPPSTPK